MAKNNNRTEQYEKDMSDYVKRVYSGNIKTKLRDGDLETLKDKMRHSLEIDVQQLVSTQKFISGLILRFPVIPVRDARVSTALTDGTNIYFDIDFYTKLNKQERIFVLAHEVWHNALLHFLRRENRNPDVWNIATDCEINYALHEDGYTMPDGLCYPQREDEGKCAEDIYDRLIKYVKNQPSNGNCKQDGRGSSSGSGSSGGKGYTTTGGTTSDKFKEQFDKHADKNKNGENGSGEDGDVDGGGGSSFKAPTDKWGEKGFDSDYRPCVSDSAADKIREMVVSEAQRYERTRGSLPGSVKRILDTICKPEVRWEELLSQFVTSCLGDRRQWLPPLRRAVYSGMYFQSRRGEKINVTCIVDTSGSTTGDLPKFLCELTSLLDTFGNYELTIIHCDCMVHRVDTFDVNNPFPVDNPLEYSFDGGGGSSLTPAFEEIYKRGLEPSCNIVFTDGYIECPEKDPLGVPTLFILTSDGNENLCEWGTKIRFKSDKTYES